MVYEGNIWVVGGNNSSGDLNDIWTSSNPDDNSTWKKQTTPIVNGMKDHKAQVFDGKIWILGGNAGGNMLQKYYIFYSVTQDPAGIISGFSWSSAVPNWSQRSSMASLNFDNHLWVIGGDNGTGSSSKMKDVWKYGQ